MISVLVFIIVVICLINWYYVFSSKYKECIKKYRTPPALPLIGHAHLVRNSTDIIPLFNKIRCDYGSVFIVLFGIRPRMVISDCNMAKLLLGSPKILDKSYEYNFFHSWIGRGLLTSVPTKWAHQRKFITPAFHFNILESFIEVFNSQSDILIEKFKGMEYNKPFDLLPYISLCTLDIICEAAMGTSVNAQNDSGSEYVRSVKGMCRIITERTLSAIKMWDFLYQFSKDYKNEQKYCKVLHEYTDAVIVKRRKELSLNQVAPNQNDDVGIKKRLAFLDLLLQSSIVGKPLSNEEIRQEVDTFMFEGHDTTTSGISFTLYLLAKYPEIQEKIIDELDNILANNRNGPVTYKDLQDMKYLEMVIKESMRLFPPVPVYSRELMEDVEFDGSVLPKGLTLTIFPYGLHRDPVVFPDPEKFDPERFSIKNSMNRSPYSYLPFSAGPRNCIGQRFAMLEIKSTVSKILRNFKLLPIPDHEPILEVEVTMKSANGLPIRIEKRNA